MTDTISPPSSIRVDRDGDLWQPAGNGKWRCRTEPTQYLTPDMLDADYGPTVEYVPATRVAELEAENADLRARLTRAVTLPDRLINAWSHRLDAIHADVRRLLDRKTNLAAVFGYELGHDDAQRSVSDDHARALLDLIDCARQVDPSEREMLLRAEGCGMCGWDHVAALSNAVDAMPADAPAAAATTSADEPRCCECDQPASHSGGLVLRWAGKHWCSKCAQLPALPPAAAATTGGEAQA